MTFDITTLPGQRLAIEPAAWVLQGLGDQMLVVYADARGHEDGLVLSEISLEGTPLAFMPVVIGPEALLDESYTEDATEYSANEFDWMSAEGKEFVAVPDVWHVAIEGRHELVVHANDHEERDGEHVFTLAVRGGGPGLPVLRVSDGLVTAVRREQLDE